ncbi:MAG: hypothetical protein ACHP84_02735 [Caulobacterales bacterium]
MTQETHEVAFQRELADLLERFERSIGGAAQEQFAGAGNNPPLEHTTRIHLLDELLELLGWTLGLGGDVEEEARLKAGTTTFMDYLGVARDTNTPALLVEAKAFDKPFITPGAKGANIYNPAELMAQAIGHWRGGGARLNSPATPDWHDYLGQVGKYVRDLHAHYGHSLPRAVLASGRWFVVFKRPVATFVDEEPRAADIEIFELPDLPQRALQFYGLVCKPALVTETPYHVRATQSPGYIAADNLVACFHALHLSYETTGSPMVVKRPRILVYAALVLQRNDGALVTVLDHNNALDLSYQRGNDDLATALLPHLGEVEAAAAALLAQTGQQLGVNLQPASIDGFPGYPIDAKADQVKSKSLLKRHPVQPDVFMLVTGQATHFLKQAPVIECTFHRWATCNAQGQASAQGAISMPMMASPRSFFTDEQPHHCAHQGLHDRREARCQVPLIDERICCQSCIYAPVCWPGAQQPPLPCGN